ncbi:hypothetical protein [Sphingobacterium griseoflavum]|uniref:Lipoprotein n=1 Tax=Sphingobacterium griseoflavum TaxID=1474952 RepID=A0ABQ3HS46_9SPHI|nr:hypothetical protein [Sphingobacterium griseoflavum]GHE29202.1 hypothetical protein GCM10017764_09890 [Sphingobacterium griseoflavum]
MKSKFFYIVLSALIVCACTKEKEVMMEPADGLEVKLVVASGWCGKEKTVVINENQTSRDLRENTCKKSKVYTVRKTDEATFEKLRNFLRELDLYEREYRECDRCRDGVDYILTINDGERVIEQSIGFENKEKGMEAFRAFLEEL